MRSVRSRHDECGRGAYPATEQEERLLGPVHTLAAIKRRGQSLRGYGDGVDGTVRNPSMARVNVK